MTARQRTAGLYIHVPFCSGKCAYCDFYSLPSARFLITRFVSAAATELDLRAHEASPGIDSIYFGGGTPGLLPPQDFSLLLEKAASCLSLTNNPEITAELNPENVSPTFLRDLKKTGVNRVSLGIQTLSDNTLSLLGRRTDAKRNRRALRAVSDIFGNWSADLILGLPGRTLPELLREIRFLVETGATHLSLYALHLSRTAPLKKILRQKRLRLPEDRDEYFRSAELLENLGFIQYEISNWSRSRKSRSRHNLHYWNTDPVLGIGPAAAGTLNGLRRANRPDLESYIRNLESGKTPPCRRERITPLRGRNEYLMMRLRLTEGVLFREYRERTGFSFMDTFKPQVREIGKEGFGILSRTGFRLNRKGFFVSNTLISRFFLDDKKEHHR